VIALPYPWASCFTTGMNSLPPARVTSTVICGVMA
jgi:hypothetical protein